MGKLIVPDHTGHSTFEFDKTNPASVEAIERRVNELVKEGRAIAVRTGPGEFKRVKAFDPNAEETQMVPALMGG